MRESRVTDRLPGRTSACWPPRGRGVTGVRVPLWTHPQDCHRGGAYLFPSPGGNPKRYAPRQSLDRSSVSSKPKCLLLRPKADIGAVSPWSNSIPKVGEGKWSTESKPENREI